MKIEKMVLTHPRTSPIRVASNTTTEIAKLNSVPSKVVMNESEPCTHSSLQDEDPKTVATAIEAKRSVWTRD